MDRARAVAARDARVNAVAADLAVRPARGDDAARLAEIWNVEATTTLNTTDTEARDAGAQRAWLASHSPSYPVLVATAADRVAGYAALSPYRPKPAFRRTVEDSVYVDRAWRGRGVGHLLVAQLVAVARDLGHHSVIARITADNVASRRLHETIGFRLVGVEEAVAFKLGRWIDVAAYQLRL